MQLSETIKGEDFKSSTRKMPVLFIGHGSPMNAIEENEFVKGWRSIGGTLPKPKAILCVSAHWVTEGTWVTAMENPRTIHDFMGFPKELYDLRYPAPGSPELAVEIKEIIKRTEVRLDKMWGLDHGCWSVMKNLYPAADIPVIQLSLDYYKSSQDHYELARELSNLRGKGILIIGSGNMVHNLRLVSQEHMIEPGFGYEWALEADKELLNFIYANDHQALIDYKLQGREINLAIPTPEHFLPLLYTLALKEENETIDIFNNKPIGGSLTMTSIIIRSNQV
jgi:4,5-DOPA dioxygenase extradiol